MAPTTSSIQPNSTIAGPAMPEPVEAHVVTLMGTSARTMGVGRHTGTPFHAILTADQLVARELHTDSSPFDGDARKWLVPVLD